MAGLAASAHYPGRAPIDAYGNGGFRFADMSHRGSILCLPTGIYAWAAVSPAKAQPPGMPTNGNPDQVGLGMLPAPYSLNYGPMQSQQSVPAFMEYIRRDNPYAATTIPEPREEALRRALMPSATLDQFRDYLASKLRVYFSVSQWMEDSAKYDFSLGLRLHGNMVAFQSAVP